MYKKHKHTRVYLNKQILLLCKSDFRGIRKATKILCRTFILAILSLVNNLMLKQYSRHPTMFKTCIHKIAYQSLTKHPALI